MEVELKDTIIDANTGADAIKRAPIVDYNTGRKCLRIGDISNKRKYNKWGYTEVNEENYKKYKLQKEDILIARTGSTIGINTFIEQDYKSVYNNGLIRLKINKSKYNSKFIYYVIQTNKFKNYINGIAFGTTGQPNMKINDLLKFKFHYIPLEIQNKIVKILDNLNKKIELNNQINDNLLELIKLLYIEKIKENNDECFEEKTLDEFCNIFTGKKNANANEENGKYKFFTCAPEPLNINSYIYDGPAIIVAGNGAYTGRTTFYNGKFDLYQRTYGITSLENNDYIYLLYVAVYTDLQNNIMGGTHGSAIPYIIFNDIAKFKIKYNEKIYNELSEQIKSLLIKVKSNELENETLEQLRDTLLPKLMSGEIELDNIEI